MKRRWKCDLLVLLVLLAWGTTVHAELRAGAARVALPTAPGVPLGGYAARKNAASTGVHDPVYARALVLAEGTKRVAIVSLDLCFVPADLKAETVRRLPTGLKSSLPGERLFLAATHTHTAPDPLLMHTGNLFRFPGWPLYDATALQTTAQQIAEAITKAEAALAPARLRIASERRPDLQRNRRGDPLTDPELTLLQIRHTDDRPLATLINFAAHPTLYDADMLQISADWPGVLAKAREQKGDEVCLFLNGAEGDMSPAGATGDTQEARVQDYGLKVARAVTALETGGMKLVSDALDAWTETVVLPPRRPNGWFLAAATQFGATVAQARDLVKALMPERTVVSFVRIGPCVLIGLPCEPTAALGLQAKERARKAGWSQSLVVALTNDWLGYALTPEQYRKGNYEAGMSFFGETLGPTLLDAVGKGLKRTTE